MNFKNLYVYMTVNELLKIIKYQQPTVLNNEITLSNCNNKTLIILPRKSNTDFLYNASLIWNHVIKILETPTIHEISVEVFEKKCKSMLHERQRQSDKLLWNDENMNI